MRIRPPHRDGLTEPDINFIPLIDILLVIVIFLVISTTFIRQSQLKVELPGSSNGQQTAEQQAPIQIRIGRDGNYALDRQGLMNTEQLRTALLKRLKQTPKGQENRAILEADALTSHQAVVTAMDVLASVGVTRVSIATAQSR